MRSSERAGSVWPSPWCWKPPGWVCMGLQCRCPRSWFILFIACWVTAWAGLSGDLGEHLQDERHSSPDAFAVRCVSIFMRHLLIMPFANYWEKSLMLTQIGKWTLFISFREMQVVAHTSSSGCSHFTNNFFLCDMTVWHHYHDQSHHKKLSERSLVEH